jgi:hypothetical protein
VLGAFRPDNAINSDNPDRLSSLTPVSLSLCWKRPKRLPANVPQTLADGSYHTVANLTAGEQRGQTLVMAERYQAELRDPYFKDQFSYDAATDSTSAPGDIGFPFAGIADTRSLVYGRYVSIEHQGRPVAHVLPSASAPRTDVPDEPLGSGRLTSCCASTAVGCKQTKPRISMPGERN